MYTRIFVAVDNSDTSKSALQEAIKLAKNQKAKLCIVYVANEFIPAGEGIPVNFEEHEKNVRKNAQDLLNEMVIMAKKTYDQVEYRLIEITESDNCIPQMIIAEAEKWQADLIVLGTHGRQGLTRLLLGSVAEEVMRKTTIPVHIIHGHEE